MEEVRCYLYWIRTEEMTDIFTQGYVGISVRPEYRFYQHKQNAKSGKVYNKAFLKALKDGTAFQQIILIGSVQYCKDVEKALRPLFYVAWNVAPGGDSGSVYKHGLTGSKVKGIYYNILTKSKESGAIMCEEWLADNGGLVTFNDFYTSRVGPNQCVSIAGLEFISPETVKVLTQQELVSDIKRSVEFNGEVYTYSELGDKFGMKPNTLVWRLRRGETVNQALGLEEKPKRTVVLNKKEYEYCGRLSDGELEELKADYEAGVVLTVLATKFGFDHGNLSKLVRRLGFERESNDFTKDFFGEPLEVSRLFKLTVEDYNASKEMLLEGLPRYLIAEKLGISGSSMTDVCRRLKWKEYLSEQQSMGDVPKNMEDSVSIHELSTVGNTEESVEPESDKTRIY